MLLAHYLYFFRYLILLNVMELYNPNLIYKIYNFNHI